jgi:hypothetical protein
VRTSFSQRRPFNEGTDDDRRFDGFGSLDNQWPHNHTRWVLVLEPAARRPAPRRDTYMCNAKHAIWCRAPLHVTFHWRCIRKCGRHNYLTINPKQRQEQLRSNTPYTNKNLKTSMMWNIVSVQMRLYFSAHFITRMVLRQQSLYLSSMILVIGDK